MLAGWLFTIAAVMVGIGISFVYKQLARRLTYRITRNEHEQQGVQKEQSRFFVHIAMVEIIPIFLIILGFMMSEDATLSTVSKSIMIMLIVVVLIVNFLQMHMENKELQYAATNLEKSEQNQLKVLPFIGYSLAIGIPFISTIGILII